MDFGSLLQRAGEIIWARKFLIILGIIVAVTSGGGGGGASSNFSGDSSFFDNPPGETAPGDFGDFEDFENMPVPSEEDLEDLFVGLGIALPIVFALICVGFIVGIVLWVIRRTAEGALIAGVDMEETERNPTFGTTWAAGWQKAAQLVLIDLILAIPVLILVALMVGGIALAVGGAAAITPELGALALIAIPIACVMVILGIAITILRQVADRVCVLEDETAMESLVTAWEIIRANFGSVLAVAIIQLLINLVIAVIFFLPGILIALCCLLWPLLIAFSGAVEAYFSAFWTLAFRQWSPEDPASRDRPQPAPAV